jgi:hypothetical protein
MPVRNDFRHQVYSEKAPAAPYERFSWEPTSDLDCEDCRQRMRRVGQILRDQRVSAIFLVHGTFAGNDALGVLRELDAFMPGWSESLRRQHKLLIDRMAGQAGNYTNEYAERFESLINEPNQPHIPVLLFYWSSENHHLGRADAAVRLLSELIRQAGTTRKRFLLWGHSHAGNVFALMTNLLGGTPESRQAFFRAGRPYFRLPLPGAIKEPAWPQLREQLNDRPELRSNLELDLVTFGTPIRYGWETLGYHRLLHFIHHRSVPGLPEYRAAFPFSVADALDARYGDYVQQLGIAGTNFAISLLRWRYRLAERRLHDLLQSGLHWRDTLQRLQRGQRVPAEGHTLLVDYQPAKDPLNQQVFGHAVYTRPEWLVSHAEQVVQKLYEAQQP